MPHGFLHFAREQERADLSDWLSASCNLTARSLMNHRTIISFTTAVLFLLTTSLSFPADPDGKSPSVSPAGTWKWTPANPDGRAVEFIFHLRLEGKVLTGTVTRSTGTTVITNGVIKGDEVFFQTTRGGQAGKSTTTTYTGKLSGDTIKGTVEIDSHGKKITDSWEVARVSE